MINTTIMTVSPSKAKKMLEMNVNNRPVNESHVNFLVSEIINGNWKVNGESIKIGKDRLIDGQHRLHAIIKANKSAKTVVMTGISDDVFDTVDTGSNRSHKDILSIKGEKYANQLASILLGINRYYNVGWYHSQKISNSEVERLLEEYPKARESVASGYRATGLFSPKVINLCHFIFSEIDPDQANKFISAMCTGVDLPAKSPIHALRNKIMTASLSGTPYHYRSVGVMVVKTWNLWRKGKTASRLQFKAQEPMPKAI